MEYSGSIKSFNPAKGWGFIECPETHAAYGKDIFVLAGALPRDHEVFKGDRVSFSVVQGDNGMQAATVRLAGGPRAHMGGATIGRVGGCGGGCGGGGGGGPYAGGGGGNSRVGGSHMPQQQMHARGAPRGAPAPSAQFIGTVKSWNTAKGWGFVTSDVIIQLYGKDILFRNESIVAGPIAPGQQVAFAVVQGQNGPLAENVQPFGAAPAPMMGGGGGCGGGGYGGGHHAPPSFFGAAPPSMMPQHSFGGPPPSRGGAAGVIGKVGGGGSGGGSRGMARPPSQNDRYFGVVRTYSEEKGWGHVECAAAHAVFQKDVFLLRSACNGQAIGPGALVSFKATMGNKGPQASEVSLLPAGAFVVGGEPGNPYTAAVKSFNEEKGWGFVTSEEIQRIFGKDIFLHRRELQEQQQLPGPGDVITFCVEQGPNGQLEAKQVQTAGGDYGATMPGHGGGARVKPY